MLKNFSRLRMATLYTAMGLSIGIPLVFAVVWLALPGIELNGSSLDAIHPKWGLWGVFVILLFKLDWVCDRLVAAQQKIDQLIKEQ
ncbi:hypothetical protein ACSFCW_19080 [Yokenella regensburgei]|uniref:hypothetical protein n=1 Tax=Yokenella regensburgei TaxID=158877 RepID=UPI0035AD7761